MTIALQLASSALKTSSLLFSPHEQNADQCGVNATTNEVLPCNLGKKAIAVLGGKLDINALPHECPSWVNLRSKRSSSPPVADDLMKDSPNMQGVGTATERTASQTSKVSYDDVNEVWTVNNAAKNNGIRTRLKPKDSLEGINASGKPVTLS